MRKKQNKTKQNKAKQNKTSQNGTERTKSWGNSFQSKNCQSLFDAIHFRPKMFNKLEIKEIVQTENITIQKENIFILEYFPFF